MVIGMQIGMSIAMQIGISIGMVIGIPRGSNIDGPSPPFRPSLSVRISLRSIPFRDRHWDWNRGGGGVCVMLFKKRRKEEKKRRKKKTKYKRKHR